MVARGETGPLGPGAVAMPRALRQPLAAAARSRCPLQPVVQLVRELGFDGLSYFALPEPLPRRSAGADTQAYHWATGLSDWQARYLERRYAELDPRLAWSRHLTPFLWDRIRCARSTEAEGFLADAAAHGIGSGVVVQFRASLGCRIVVAFDWKDSAMGEARIDFALERLGSLMLVATTLHDWVFEPRLARALSPVSAGGLSSREMRCLALAARGHTSSEIGRLLQIKRRTADFHMHNAIRKLGALNRSEAIGRAVAKGLVGRL